MACCASKKQHNSCIPSHSPVYNISTRLLQTCCRRTVADIAATEVFGRKSLGHAPSPGVRTRISPRRRRLSCSFGALDALGCRNPACQRAWLAAAQPGSHGGWINAHGGPSCVPLIVATLCSSDVSSPDARTHAGLALLQAGRRATCVAEGTIDGQWLLAGSECDHNGKKRGDDDAHSDSAKYSEQLLEWRARPG